MNWTVTQPYLTFSNLTALGVPHCITTREWGSVNPFVGYEGVPRLERGIHLNDGAPLSTRIVFAELVHQAQVHRCIGSDRGSIRLNRDGLISDDATLVLAIYVADCIPVFLFDQVSQAVAVLHAGRRGLMTGIIQAGVAALQRHFGSQPHNLVVGIGPGLRSCCYEIRQDLFPDLEAAGWMQFVEERDGQYFLDLSRACRLAIEACGIDGSHIEDMGLCTSCRTDILFSARRRSETKERGSSFAALISCPEEQRTHRE